MRTSLDIREPGLNILPLGVERHVVNGGGLTGIQIFPDDEIEIINDEGSQICEISVFNKDGKSELSILNLKENKTFSEIKKIFGMVKIFINFIKKLVLRGNGTKKYLIIVKKKKFYVLVHHLMSQPLIF